MSKHTSIALRSPALEELRQIVGEPRLLTDPVSLHLYKFDAAFDEALPAAVVLPESTAEVAAIVRICGREGLPFVARGAGTSLCGGSIPAPDSLVVSLTRLNRILEISPADLCAVVQPGVINLNLQDRLEPLGFFYAPDPSSQLVSTLGGNVGHDAGGAHCLKYGVTHRHILALELVTPTGEIVRLGSRATEESGYNLLGLLVGSEGTLGIITEITCRLTPRPQSLMTALAAFDSLEDASAAVSAIIAHGIIPAALEMIDRPLIEAVEQHLEAGYPPNTAAVLLIEVDGPREALAEQIAALEELCRQYRAREFKRADSEAQRERLWRGRKGTAAALGNLAPGKISTDVVVPRDVLPQMVAQVMEIGQAYNLTIGNILHAGDGNLHPQIVFDPRDKEQVSRVFAAQEEIVKAALAHGGCLTGEHGIGTEKRRFMALMFRPGELALMRGLKAVFDPQKLSNPNKLLPEGPEHHTHVLSLPEGNFAQAAVAVAVEDAPGCLRPYDYEATAKLLALAAREGQPIRLTGAGSLLSAQESERQRISLLGLHHILAIESDNMTVTTQAGVRLSELQQALAQAGQWWPVLPPAGAQATVGGVLSAGLAGPLALRYGRLSDLITAVRLALTSGEVLQFGAPCAKNVAGYALERLLVGSQGTLAALLEVTLRTLPRPEKECTWLTWGNSLSSVEELCRRVLSQGVRPAAVELVNHTAAAQVGVNEVSGEAEWSALVTFQGQEAEVAAGEATLRDLTGQLDVEIAPLCQPETGCLWQMVADLGLTSGTSRGVAVNCPPSRCGEVLSALETLANRFMVPVPLIASPGLGRIRLTMPVTDREEMRLALDLLRTIVQTRKGTACWLPPSEDEAIMRASAGIGQLNRQLKQLFDPSGVLPRLRDFTYD